MSKFGTHEGNVEYAVDQLKWAVECLETFESQCLLEIHTDKDELWDWANLLKDRANKLAALVSE